MAAAYAALVSLMNVVTRYQDHTCPASFDKLQIQSLFDRVTSMVDFLEAYSQRTSKDLLRKMVDVAFATEDIIESYYVAQIPVKSDDKVDNGYDLLCQYLGKAIDAMNLIIQEAIEVKEHNGEKYGQLPESSARVDSVLPPRGTVKMVGFDEELLSLMDQLNSHQSSPRIIPIVGMGGIGKTTLARSVYNHKYVRHKFDTRAWATISQDFTVEKIIHSLLIDIRVNVDEIEKTKEVLGDKLYKSLWDRKYLIILDDVWDKLAWDEIKKFFPNNNNKSRILLTTRISNVAVSVGSSSPHEIKLLNSSKSWDLLSYTVFGQEVCPSGLIKCGEQIAKSCRGLPLTISVIGGLLKISHKTLEYWENVAENINSFINVEDDGHCLEILSLSYNHLPIYLKPCFLYMATFKEDSVVNISFLINQWVSDGFLRPNKDRTLEEVAFDYLNDLINRNLIMAGKRHPTGKILNCSLHDLLREFCLSEAQNERFLCQIEKNMLDPPQRLECERRLVCEVYDQKIKLCNPTPSMSPARSFIDNSEEMPDLIAGPVDLSSCRLLRVLVSTAFDIDVTHHFNLRHLKCVFSKGFDVLMLIPLVSLFWNLETLIIRGDYGDFNLPSGFWELPNLRHLIISQGTIFLPEPRDVQTNCILNRLQTLGELGNFNCTDDVLNKIPNLQTLSIRYNLEYSSEELEELSFCFTNLASLHKLEKLSCYFSSNSEDDICVFNVPNNLTFSPNLRELNLTASGIPWNNMTTIGSLSNLEVLKLEYNAFCGEEWNSTEGDFQCLKFLSIRSCGLRIWRVESSHFPSLENLELLHLDLEEIPSCIGEVTCLRKIRIVTKKLSAVISAKEILDERQYQGDDDLLIKGYCFGVSIDEERELENFTSDNFRVEYMPNDRRKVEHIRKMRKIHHTSEED